MADSRDMTDGKERARIVLERWDALERNAGDDAPDAMLAWCLEPAQANCAICFWVSRDLIHALGCRAAATYAARERRPDDIRAIRANALANARSVVRQHAQAASRCGLPPMHT